ncbi:hypothetical protein [Clostridium estertheticum]|uniref:hypothetical protein n=1 Tax=Clostridium estertheticum TaxID=238834 RepID=UPI001C7E1296|nr:hypothetical protein [Clostridium estertheticum]MBX4272192.1 hypothetical protein [Clostridium estertheticum]
MKPTEAKKQIIKLFEDDKDEEAVSLWYNILRENQSITVSQHIFNNAIYKIGFNDWNQSHRSEKFIRIYSITNKILDSGLFTLLIECKFMTQNKKSLDCLMFISAAILNNGDTVTFNKFIKELYTGCSYDEFKGVLQECIFKFDYRYVMFSNPQSIKLINDTILESNLLEKDDKVLFTLMTDKFSEGNKDNYIQSVDAMNIIEDSWDNEEIKCEAVESLLREGFMKNKLNIVRIFTSDNQLLIKMCQKNGFGNDRFNILMFEERFRKLVFDMIFQNNDDLFIIPVVKFIHECFEIKITEGSIFKSYSGETENCYAELKKCVIEYSYNNIDIIEKTISEMFSYKSRNIIKFFIKSGLQSIGNNDTVIGFKNQYNRPIFEGYLKYRVEDLYKYIESKEQYYNYIAKIYPYIDDSFDKKKDVFEETYRYSVNNKQTWMIIELIEGITQNDKTFAKEIIIDLICNETDDRFQITSYYNPKRMLDVFGMLDAYFKDTNVYKLLSEKFIFNKKAFSNVIDYFEYTLSFDSDWSVHNLIYEEIFFVAEDLDSVFNLYIKYSEKIYGITPYFYEIENIAKRDEFIGNRKEQIIKGFTQVYHHLKNNNFEHIDNFRDNLTNHFKIKL